MISCLGFLLTCSAFATDLQIKNPIVRLLPKSALSTGVYMTISNNSNEEKILLQATSPKAERVEIHNVVRLDGMMKMIPIKSLAIPPKGEVKLKKGSYHIMLMGLKSALKEGEKVKVVLHFSNKEVISIDALTKDLR